MRINVGGFMFESTFKTLSKSPILKEMIQKTAQDDVLFVDRDGGAFSFVLDFLRNDATVFHIDSREYIEFLMREATYYDVPLMKAQLQMQLTEKQTGLSEICEELRTIRLLLQEVAEARND